jgi:purine-cytosine permease-like protein
MGNSIFTEVPQSQLKKWPSFTILISALLIQVNNLMFGFNLRLLTDLRTFIPAVLIANAILAGLFLLSGRVGVQWRLPAATLYGKIFGKLGCKLIMLLILPTGLIWIGWMTEMVAKSLLGIYPSLNYVLIITVIVGISVLSSIKELKGMELSSNLQVPIVALVIIIAGIRVLVTGNANAVPEAPLSEKLNLVQSISYVMLTWIGFLPFYADYTRFVRTKKDLAIATGIGWVIIYSLVMIAGGLFAGCGGEGGSGIGSGGGFDLIKILGSIGIPIFVAALIMLLCTWTFNDRSLYSYGIVINFVTGRERYRSLFIILGGVVAIFCAWLGVNDRVLTVLNWIGRIFVPLLAVFAYYFYFKYPRQTRVAGGGGGGNCDCDCDCKAAHDYEHQFSYQPFVAWLLGVLISCLAENRLLLSFGISLVVYALLDSFAPAGKLGGKVAGQTETKG